ncbi:lipase family protein [Pantanalinema rosaneae CENA516]|uniref:lipase family protein n=1 Tax=Pantanalinema rosaneae TaxID=1620701 RepID=UPI003D6F2C76
MTTSIAPIRGANCFKSVFNSNATGYDRVNAYLLMVASRLIFPDQLGINWTDLWNVHQTFEGRFRPLGVDQFDFASDLASHHQYDTDGVVMSNNEVIIVVFRGTELSASWSSRVRDFIRTNTNIVKAPMSDFGTDIKVHSGFWNAFQEVRDDIIRLVNKHRTSQQRIWVTGHSLGGAQAVLTAITLQAQSIPVQGLYTYGCPRIGNEQFSRLFARMNVQRYVYALDLVPMLPDDLFLGYRHVGKTNNIRVLPFPGAGPYDSSLDLDSPEVRMWGNVKDHDVQRYEAALFHNLRFQPNQQGNVPLPALQH